MCKSFKYICSLLRNCYGYIWFVFENSWLCIVQGIYALNIMSLIPVWSCLMVTLWVPMFSVLIVLLIIAIRNMVHFEMLLKETELALWRVFLAHLYHKSIVLRCACNLLKAYSVGIQLISAGPCVCMLPKAAQVHVHRSGMISAYDLYELFMYGVVCHFTLH